MDSRGLWWITRRELPFRSCRYHPLSPIMAPQWSLSRENTCRRYSCKLARPARVSHVHLNDHRPPKLHSMKTSHGFGSSLHTAQSGPILARAQSPLTGRKRREPRRYGCFPPYCACNEGSACSRQSCQRLCLSLFLMNGGNNIGHNRDWVAQKCRSMNSR
jgi:hypothetical protein